MKKLAAVVGCAVWLVAFGSVARSADILVGVENVRFGAPLMDKDTDDKDFDVSHSWSAATATFELNKNLSFHIALGGLTTTLEDDDIGATYTDDSGFRWSAGMQLTQELDMGGGILFDISAYGVSHETSDWNYAVNGVNFRAAYAFFDPTRARPFAGVAYNAYDGSLDHDIDALDRDLEYQFRLNFLGGIYARTTTFMGVMELILGGEFTVRLGLEFGF